MLPTGYETPVAIALVLGGAVACFAGYRLFRVVLAIYGFIAGAMLASSMMASSNSVGMVVAALLGGAIGSIVLFFAYFLGVALVGAGLGAFVLRVGWPLVSTLDPPVAVVLLFVAIGTIVAVLLQRFVIILATSFAGAWTVIIGALTLASDSAAVGGRPASDVWLLYPFSPEISERWAILAWIVLGLLGAAVQLNTSGRKR